MSEPTRIFSARRILTMNAYRPEATHVAVREGRILGVGDLDDLTGWGGDWELDDRFEDQVLMPGLVEGHCHEMEGKVWDFPFVGYNDRRDPNGKMWPGVKSIDEVVDRLSRIEAEMSDPDATLFAWGFDPIFYTGRRMVAADLDRVSTTRPVVVIHQSFHLMNVNSVVLERAGISGGSNVDGVLLGEDGKPTGELRELAAKFIVFRVAGNPFFTVPNETSLRRFAQSAVQAGVTTATDLHAKVDDEAIELYRRVSDDADYPMRIVPAVAALSAPSLEAGIELIAKGRERNTDKLHFGLVKVMTDGSIQGFSARLNWPGYYDGSPNGVWNAPPSELMRTVSAHHAAGNHIHIHTNGDEASELMIDAIEAALLENPRADHRHTLQHCQMADEAQYRRMAALGICVNLFSNHIYYWGDQHRALTMGPDRAARMDAAGTALRLGVPCAIHSDAPVTPLGPLFTAWCAVNRLTASGYLLGPEERITVPQALHAITLGAAYTLKLDHLLGSVEVGKLADFTVLDDDPLSVGPEQLKDIPVWGTVLGGKPFKAPEKSG